MRTPASNKPAVSWTPLDDYRAAKRDDSFATPAERLSRDSILVHCVCINCKARRCP